MHSDKKKDEKSDSYSVSVTAYDSDEETAITRLTNRYAEVKEAVVSSEGYRVASVWGEKVYKGGSWLWGHFKNASWVVGTTLLVVAMPLVFEFDREVAAEQQRRASLAKLSMGSESSTQKT